MVLQENLPAVRADRLLRDPEYCGALTSEELYDLILVATGNEEQARQGMSQRAMQRMEAGLKP